MDRFYSFVKNPEWSPKIISPDIKHLIHCFIFYLVITFPLAILAYIACSLAGIDHKSPGLNSLSDIILIILIAPFYEEIFFRSLLRFNRRNFILFISVLILIITYGLVKRQVIFIVSGSVVMAVAFSIIGLFREEHIASFFSRHISGVFYLSSICFGLLHIVNFNGNLFAILSLSVILCGPQIVAGLLLGYIRIKYGLTCSILFHVLINMSVLLNI